MFLVTTEEMRALEKRTMGSDGQSSGPSEEDLMETAGQAVSSHLKEGRAGTAPLAHEASVLVLCGPGNNGGDGFVVARSLRAAGFSVEVLGFARAERYVGAAATKKRAWEDAGGAVVLVTEAAEVSEVFAPALARADLVVDCLLGTGITEPVRPVMAAVIDRLNLASAGTDGQDLSVVSVDLPSGVDGDQGVVQGRAVRADQTLCLGAMKRGLVDRAVASWVGQLHLLEIGIPDQAWEAHESELRWNTPEEVRALVPRRAMDDHKGRSGRVLVVGSSPSYPGAGILAARGALRGGAGLVSLAMPNGFLSAAVAALPEAMPFAREPFSDPAWRERLERVDAVVLGPGLGTEPDERRICRWLLHHARGPLVVDADGLNFIGLMDRTRFGGDREVILTPHPGEMARLCGVSVAEVQADREGYAAWLAGRSGAVVVLKGAGTIVADPAGCLYLNTTGGPLLATGGTGDVLAGLLGALMGQGLDALSAARVGVFLHGAAGDVLAGEMGDAGLLATDLAEGLPGARKRLLEAAESPRSSK